MSVQTARIRQKPNACFFDQLFLQSKFRFRLIKRRAIRADS
jgi:hypothetical protein